MKNDVHELDASRSEACRTTQRLLAKLVGKSLPGPEDTAFRAHITSCPECRRLYRATMASAARMGKAIREERESSERVRRHTEMHDRAIAATGDRRKSRRFGLRLALLPAGIALVLLLFRAGGGERGLFARSDGGSVRAAGALLDGGGDALRLQPGDWCETGASTRASILAGASDDEGVFELGGETQLLIVDPIARKVRLERGELTLAGPGIVTSAHGVLEIEDGRAELVVRGGRFALRCLDGHVSWIGPMGSRVLAAGDTIDS